MATATKKATNTTAKMKFKSVNNFILFLKRFSNVNPNLLLELHQDCLKAKSHTEDKAVVKYSKMPLVDVMDGSLPVAVEMVKIGLLDINKVINIFKHFSDTDEVFLDIKYELVGGEYVCTELLFYTSALKIKVLAASTDIFNYIAPELLKRILDSVNSEKIVDFPFPKDAFIKVNSLCSIDTGKDFLTLKAADGSIKMVGRSFEYTVGDAASNVDVEFTFYNEYFGLIEKDISSFTVGRNKMLVKSQESDTLVIIGRVE